MNHMVKSRFLAEGVALAIMAVGSGAVAAVPGQVQKERATIEFRQKNPTAIISERFGKPHKIAAPRMATGQSPRASANRARADLALMMGVDPVQFAARGPFPDGRDEVLLGYDPATDSFAFTSLYWTQMADGLEVWRTRMNILVRNTNDYPAVYATTVLRDVGGFTAPADIKPNLGLARAAATQRLGITSTISEPQVVCFAGVNEVRSAPRAAMIFDAEAGSPAAGNYQKFLLVVDLETGQILYEETGIHHNVDGTCTGRVSEGSSAAGCVNEVAVPMPHILVSGGNNSVYANAAGNFTLPSSGSVTATAGVDGRWFVVDNVAGGETSASTTIPNNGFGTIELNSGNNDESIRAQVNAYRESNIIRDYVLSLVPDYPIIGTESAFQINVGVSGTCNAFYNGSSINFYNAGDGCSNTAFSVIVHHEYGHHLVNVAGSGQGSYGEGLGDICGIAITGDPELARGFFEDDCQSGIRNANNNFQYPCTGGSSVHYCGQLLSACFYDMLGVFASAGVPNSQDVVSRLFFESVTLHVGEGIDPTITLDILTLDDDDGDLSNGTPNEALILEAMALHNMDQIPEPLSNDFCGSALAVVDGSTSFSNIGAFSDSDSYNDTQCTDSYLGQMASDVWFSYEACESGSMTVSTCDTISFDSDLVVYSGTCDNKSQVSCNGDGSGCGSYTSSLSFNAVAGTRYLIRVGGYDANGVGSGSLIIDGPGTGPPCVGAPLDITLPGGVPPLIQPDGTTTFAVNITPGNPGDGIDVAELRYRAENSGPWLTASLNNNGGSSYVAQFPSLECGLVAFYITATNPAGTVTLPAAGESAPYEVPVLTDLVVAFDDTFQTDQGWSVTAGATEGNWERAVPANGGARCDNPTDADGSGSCYVTGNATNEDVDGTSATILTSPLIVCEPGSTLSYWRWYNNGSTCGGSEANSDVMEVEISFDGGSSYSSLETVGPVTDASGEWVRVFFPLETVPNGSIAIRFVVVDANGGSIIEAAVDGVQVESPICDVSTPCPEDINPDGVINVDDLLLIIAGFGSAAGDITGDGQTTVDDVLALLSVFGSLCE